MVGSLVCVIDWVTPTIPCNFLMKVNVPKKPPLRPYPPVVPLSDHVLAPQNHSALQRSA